MSSTRISYHINAPRAAVYRALLDPRAVAKWKVPEGMTAHVHAFDAREGRTFRISLGMGRKPGRSGNLTRIERYFHNSRLALTVGNSSRLGN